jgi:hypothetical protein
MALGRAATVRGTRSISIADDLIQATVAADKLVIIDCFELSQSTVTAAIEVKEVIAQRAATTAGTGGALTAEANDPGDAVTGVTWLENTSTNATLTGSPLRSEAWNFLAPLIWRPKEDNEEWILGGQDIFVFRLNAAPAGATTFFYTVSYRVLG